ncbi:hypothetical protein ANCDUO_01936 [Ancylostoma duodenale]|uniref:Uncharacterized protein n=1 Tax=Ancylostoma duodenale TaxID=51022 RepID=A0A0C2DD07_9BILA|nr:hypothetical protein ANCDUO_01936 [Ancylostoma duodenale]
MDSKSLTRTEMIASSQLPVYQDLWYEIGVNRRIKYVKGIRNASLSSASAAQPKICAVVHANELLSARISYYEDNKGRRMANKKR